MDPHGLKPKFLLDNGLTRRIFNVTTELMERQDYYG